MTSLVTTQIGFPLLIAAVVAAVPLAALIRRSAAAAWAVKADLKAILATGAAMTMTAALAAPDAPAFGASLALGWTLTGLAIIDSKIMRLPDALTLPLLILGLAVAAFRDRDQLLDHLIGAVAGYAILAGVALVYRRVRHREGLGLGDAKLFACAGAWLGWRSLPTVLLIGSLLGIGWAVARRNREAQAPIAFGPALALAFWINWLWVTHTF